MAELVDALVSGTSILTDVQVRVMFRAPNPIKAHNSCGFFVLNSSNTTIGLIKKYDVRFTISCLWWPPYNDPEIKKRMLEGGHNTDP